MGHACLRDGRGLVPNSFGCKEIQVMGYWRHAGQECPMSRPLQPVPDNEAVDCLSVDAGFPGNG